MKISRAPLPVLLATVLLATVSACSDDDSPDAGTSRDATAADASIAADAGIADVPGPMDSEVFADAESNEDAEPPSDASAPDASEPDATEPADAGEAGPFTLTSATVSEGGMIPEDHACPAPDVQPALEWINPPAGTQSYVLVLIDDTIDFVHWVAFNIPATTTSLAEAASDDMMLPQGASEANAYCRRYCGPCPGNRHTYTFRVYALDVATINFTRSGAFGDEELDADLDANTLGLATLTATYTP